MAKTSPISPLSPQTMPPMPPIAGIKLAVGASGESYKARNDTLLIVANEPLSIAGVFTQNSLCGAPVTWNRENIRGGKARAILVNAGNANVMTGKAGFDAAQKMAEQTAKLLNASPSEIMLGSTGVIGKPLDTGPFEGLLPKLCSNLSSDLWEEAAKAIMTTDTYPKYATAKTKIDDKEVTISGIAKGSGMIEPNMATMLSYIATDAAIDPHELHLLLRSAVKDSFNAVTVDGDSSTSDMVLILATGKAGNNPIRFPSDFTRLGDFARALQGLCEELAQMIARDGEGASKMITVKIFGAKNEEEATHCAKAIANSPLVKTTIAGGDANWGRVAMAIGKSGVALDHTKLGIDFGPHTLAEQGTLSEHYDEEAVSRYLKGQEIEIKVYLHAGDAKARVWTCDLTHGYIDINADYRS